MAERHPLDTLLGVPPQPATTTDGEVDKQLAIGEPTPNQGADTAVIADSPTTAGGVPTPVKLTREAEGGLESRREYGRALTRDIYSTAKKTPYELDLQLSEARQMTGDASIPLDSREISQAMEPAWYESIFQVFEPFDVPRRALWDTMNSVVADVLPDPTQPGENPTATSLMGDAMQAAAGELVGAGLYVGAHMATFGLLGEAIGELTDDRPEGQSESGMQGKSSFDIYEVMAERLYDAVATGHMEEMGEKTQGKVWFWGDTEWNNSRGIHLVDSMITKDEAQYILKHSDDQNLRAVASVLGSNLGRELTGIALEMAVDPLWLAGPAKGTQVVAKGDEVYHMGQAMGRAAGAIERINPLEKSDTVRRVLLDAVDPAAAGDEAVVAAREFIDASAEQARDLAAHTNMAAREASQAAAKGGDEATSYAQAVLLEQARQAELLAQRMADTGQTFAQTRALSRARQLEKQAAKIADDADGAVEFLKNYSTREYKVARAWLSDAQLIEKASDFARRGEQVVQKGYGAWHVPFSNKTRYLVRAEDGKKAARAVQDYMPDPLLSKAWKLAEYGKSLSPSKLAGKVAEASGIGKLATEVLTGAEKWAWAYYQTTESVSVYPLAVWDWLAKAFGTRHIQPMVSAISVDKQLAGYGRQGVARRATAGLMRLRKANPEVWGAYQEALGQYMRRFQGLEAELGVNVRRLMHEAQQVHKARKRLARNNLEQTRRDMLKATARQSQGEDTAAEMARLRQRERQYLDWLNENYGVENILTEAGAMIESGAGVLSARPELRPLFTGVQDLIKDLSGKLGKEQLQLQQALANMARHMRGDPRLYEEVTAEIVRLKDVTNELGLARDAEFERIDAVVKQRLTEVRAARRLLMNTDVDSLGDAMARITAVESKRGYNEVSKQHIQEILESVFATAADPQASVQRVLREAAILMGNSDGAAALLDLAHITRADVQLGAPGMAEGPALVEALKRYVKQLEEEETQLKELLVKGPEGLDAKDMRVPRAIVNRMISYREAQLERLVGADEMKAFEQWMKDGAQITEVAKTEPLSEYAQRWRDNIKRARPSLYSEKQLDAFAIMAEARAKAWAEVTGGDPIDYWKRHLSQQVKKYGKTGAVQPGIPAAGVGSELMLGTKADVATMVHEMGHIFRFDLASMGGAGEEAIRAWAKWTKIEDLADKMVELSKRPDGSSWFLMVNELNPDDLARVRVAEEMWADGFMEYMRAGRAPTAQLQPHFDDFRKWMASTGTDWMRTAGRERVIPTMISDEVKALFGRLIGPTNEVKLRNWTDAAKHKRALDALKRVRGPKSRQERWVTVKANRLAELQQEETGKLLSDLGVTDAEPGVFTSKLLSEQRFRRLYEEDPTGELLLKAVRQEMLDAGVAENIANRLAVRFEEQFKEIYNTYHRGDSAKGAKLASYHTRKLLKQIEGQLPTKTDLKAPVRGRFTAAKKQLAESIETLTEHQQRVAPRLAAPGEPFDTDKSLRLLHDWERELWVEFDKLIETADLSDQDAMIVALSALRELPQTLDTATITRIKQEFELPSAMGQRAGEMPEYMKGVTHELRRIIASYEDLYAKHGADWVKRPEEMLRVWGVFEYVPHLEDPGGLLARAGSQRLVGAIAERARGGKTAASSGLEQALSLTMDADKKRLIEGTIAEINAATNSAVSFALNPSLIMARYGQANSALTAQEMMLSLFRGGVIKAVKGRTTEIPGGGTRMMETWEVAEAEDLVPLFRRRSTKHDELLLLHGDLEQWQKMGIGPEDINEMLGKKRETAAYASWAESIPAMRQITQTEDLVLGVRAHQYTKGQPLVDPAASFERWRATGLNDQEAWGQVAQELNKLAQQAQLKNKVNAEMLARYYDGGGAWRLHIPRVVAQSMQDVFSRSWADALPGVPTARAVLQKMNNFWKTRVTVMSIAFSMRNAFSNTMTNLLDLGPFGVLNPSTNARAIQLAQATMWHEHYGSLREAWELLSKPLDEVRTIGRSDAMVTAMKADHAARRAVFEASGFKKLVEQGIDLGDGHVHDVDELLSRFRSEGVVSQAFTQFVDMTATEQGMMQAMLEGGKGLGTRMMQAASALEDFAVVGFSALLTGGLPVAVPKKMGGEIISRTIENQARIANFMGNYRRAGNWDESVRHVEKFLFNYGDLTSFQKDWMRLIFPFFTWNQKNLVLQWDLLQTSPVAFSQFNRLMLDGLPRALQGMAADEREEAFAYEDPGSETAMAQRESHRQHNVRLPYPYERNTYISGLGLPQEAMVEKLGQIFGMFDVNQWESGVGQYTDQRPMYRFLGETHALLRFVVERAAKHHSFYDRPLSELTNGRLIAQALAPLDILPDFVSGPMRAHIEDRLGFTIRQAYNPKTGMHEDIPIVSGDGNHLFASVPWSRTIRDAAAYTNYYAVSNATPMHKWIDSDLPSPYGSAKPVHKHWRALDAITGFQLVREDPALNEVLRLMRIEETQKRLLEARGVTDEHETSYIRGE